VIDDADLINDHLSTEVICSPAGVGLSHDLLQINVDWS